MAFGSHRVAVKRAKPRGSFAGEGIFPPSSFTVPLFPPFFCGESSPVISAASSFISFLLSAVSSFFASSSFFLVSSWLVRFPRWSGSFLLSCHAGLLDTLRWDVKRAKFSGGERSNDAAPSSLSSAGMRFLPLSSSPFLPSIASSSSARWLRMAARHGRFFRFLFLSRGGDPSASKQGNERKRKLPLRLGA